MKKPCTLIHNPESKGDAGLIVVNEETVDNPNIEIESRTTRLKRLGLSERLIGAVGKKICAKCYQKILQATPRETANYSMLSWADRLLGVHCPTHKRDE